VSIRQRQVLDSLYWYCGDISGEVVDGQPIGGPEGLKRKIKAVQKDTQNFAKQLKKCSEELKRLAEVVERIRSELKRKADTPGLEPAGAELPSRMREFSGKLEEHHRILQSHLRELRTQDDGSVEGGRKQFLFDLVDRAFEVTSQPYAPIARLVASPLSPARVDSWGQRLDKYIN
jgi:hypothetical protein